ncbi:MAG: hypothetical protein VXY82_00785 [Planctomycetota bacterium]|nr:hypothetical protein [Planctomycetota bacterium]
MASGIGREEYRKTTGSNGSANSSQRAYGSGEFVGVRQFWPLWQRDKKAMRQARVSTNILLPTLFNSSTWEEPTSRRRVGFGLPGCDFIR